MSRIITDKSSELLTQVNKKNEVIGPIKRGLAHQNRDIIYRTIAVFVRKNSKYLWQKRSATKDLYPNCWDFSVGGHVGFGEEYLDCAIKELEEELGIQAEASDMKFLGEVLVTLPTSNEFFYAYEYEFRQDDKLILAKEEVDSIRWISIAEVKKSMQSKSLDWYPRPLQLVEALFQGLC
jgi:isopentenyldiphosphate isomerase